jgi:hypothetical protein
MVAQMSMGAQGIIRLSPGHLRNQSAGHLVRKLFWQKHTVYYVNGNITPFFGHHIIVFVFAAVNPRVKMLAAELQNTAVVGQVKFFAGLKQCNQTLPV